MRTHVALLRGINVGGRNRVAMAELRALVASLGHQDVATYIQSGNVVFGAGTPSGKTELATALEEAIAASLGVRPPVVVVARPELLAAIDANPFSHEPDPARVHLAFRSDDFPPGQVDELRAALERAQAKGSGEDLRVDGPVAYLHTPAGLSKSDVSTLLVKPRFAVTVRNWATVTALGRLLDEG